MTDSARTYFDSFIHLAGDPARRARDLAGRVREDLRCGGESLKSGAEQVREHGSRTASDIGRLLRAEFDASLTRIGVATQADLDDLNLRLEHSEEQIRDLRIRLAESDARAAATDAAEEKDTEPPPRPAPGAEATEQADDEAPQRPAPGADATAPSGEEEDA